MTIISVRPTLKLPVIGNRSSIHTMGAMQNDSRAGKAAYILDGVTETTPFDFPPYRYGTHTLTAESPENCFLAWTELPPICPQCNKIQSDEETQRHGAEWTFEMMSQLTRNKGTSPNNSQTARGCLTSNERPNLSRIICGSRRKSKIFPRCSIWMLPFLTHSSEIFAPSSLLSEATVYSVVYVYLSLHVESSIVVQSSCGGYQTPQKISTQSENISMKDMACPQYGGSKKHRINVVSFGTLYVEILDHYCRVVVTKETCLVDAASRDDEELLSTNVSHGLTIYLKDHEEPGTGDLCHPCILALFMIWLDFACSHLLSEAFMYSDNLSCNFAGDDDFHCCLFRRVLKPSVREGLIRIPVVHKKWGSQRARILQYLFGWHILTMCLLGHSSMACNDIREQLSEFNCLHFDADSSTFSMKCDFAWTDGTTQCIVLEKDEKFEGNGHSINLTGVSNWEGMFQIATNENSPSSLDNAPVIHGLHMIGGENQ